MVDERTKKFVDDLRAKVESMGGDFQKAGTWEGERFVVDMVYLWNLTRDRFKTDGQSQKDRGESS